MIVGPETWTIEYPATEAIAAGVARQVSADDLASALLSNDLPSKEQIDAFLADHAGAVEKTLRTLAGWGVSG